MNTGRSGRKIWIVVVILLALSGYLGYRLMQARNEIDQNNANSAQIENEATAELVNELSGFVELPTDEVPTIATVNDAKKLKSQVFFTKAQDGDRVIIYADSRLAILYRPSSKKVVTVAPISLDESAQPKTNQ